MWRVPTRGSNVHPPPNTAGSRSGAAAVPPHPRRGRGRQARFEWVPTQRQYRQPSFLDDCGSIPLCMCRLPWSRRGCTCNRSLSRFPKSRQMQARRVVAATQTGAQAERAGDNDPAVVRRRKKILAAIAKQQAEAAQAGDPPAASAALERALAFAPAPAPPPRRLRPSTRGSNSAHAARSFDADAAAAMAVGSTALSTSLRAASPAAATAAAPGAPARLASGDASHRTTSKAGGGSHRGERQAETKQKDGGGKGDPAWRRGSQAGVVPSAAGRPPTASTRSVAPLTVNLAQKRARQLSTASAAVAVAGALRAAATSPPPRITMSPRSGGTAPAQPGRPVRSATARRVRQEKTITTTLRPPAHASSTWSSSNSNRETVPSASPPAATHRTTADASSAGMLGPTHAGGASGTGGNGAIAAASPDTAAAGGGAEGPTQPSVFSPEQLEYSYLLRGRGVLEQSYLQHAVARDDSSGSGNSECGSGGRGKDSDDGNGNDYNYNCNYPETTGSGSGGGGGGAPAEGHDSASAANLAAHYLRADYILGPLMTMMPAAARRRRKDVPVAEASRLEEAAAAPAVGGPGEDGVAKPATAHEEHEDTVALRPSDGHAAAAPPLSQSSQLPTALALSQPQGIAPATDRAAPSPQQPSAGGGGGAAAGRIGELGDVSIAGGGGDSSNDTATGRPRGGGSGGNDDDNDDDSLQHSVSSSLSLVEEFSLRTGEIVRQALRRAAPGINPVVDVGSNGCRESGGDGAPKDAVAQPRKTRPWIDGALLRPESACAPHPPPLSALLQWGAHLDGGNNGNGVGAAETARARFAFVTSYRGQRQGCSTAVGAAPRRRGPDGSDGQGASATAGTAAASGEPTPLHVLEAHMLGQQEVNRRRRQGERSVRAGHGAEEWLRVVGVGAATPPSDGGAAAWPSPAAQAAVLGRLRRDHFFDDVLVSSGDGDSDDGGDGQSNTDGRKNSSSSSSSDDAGAVQRRRMLQQSLRASRRGGRSSLDGGGADDGELSSGFSTADSMNDVELDALTATLWGGGDGGGGSRGGDDVGADTDVLEELVYSDPSRAMLSATC